MGEKIIDFTRHKENKQAESAAREMITRACLQSLFDVTQEINAVMAAWRSASPIDGIRELNADGSENDNLYKLRYLLDIHGKNLLSVCRALDDVIADIDTEHEAGLISEVNSTAYKEDGETIVSKYLEYMKNLL